MILKDCAKLSRELSAESADTILNCVSAHTGFSVEALKGRRRTDPLASCRLAAYAIITELTHATFESVGRYFDDRDHGTIMYGCRQIQHSSRRGIEDYDALLAMCRDALAKKGFSV